jgi:hypothetical protein
MKIARPRYACADVEPMTTALANPGTDFPDRAESRLGGRASGAAQPRLRSKNGTLNTKERDLNPERPSARFVFDQETVL